ncbi:transaldolase family protein [methane-oxidizing endosymbiont of Gigantopelta aegis]|uniref:transaldolase family protein n=1 Tax=methane-oxidizing endosymbiont of Gigantopelta aegis TaxID=2794938 RepID=UPI0018DC9D8A|nr:transaldolase family protein [methane-oxidizing endosymbiont of Gigantopelta aegis]
MFELYLDSADVAQITHFQQFLPLKGITTNPTILARSGCGVNALLEQVTQVMGPVARFHVQVVSQTVEDIVDEAKQLNALPYDIVVKIPANENGLAAIRHVSANNIPVLATAIYTVQQGFMATLAGADYLAPYVNRIEASGADGVEMVGDLQQLLHMHRPECKILAASFKSIHQAMAVIQTGIAAITLPLDVATQLLRHTGTEAAIKQFNQDWQHTFGDKKSFQS